MKTPVQYRTEQQKEVLARLKANPRVRLIRVAAPPDCSRGQHLQGVYTKEDVPLLPGKGCSRPGGCICTYEPVLEEIYPKKLSVYKSVVFQARLASRPVKNILLG